MRYVYEGSTGGYPLEEEKQEEPEIICAICDEVCTDNFQVIDGVVICDWCAENCRSLRRQIKSIKNKYDGNL